MILNGYELDAVEVDGGEAEAFLRTRWQMPLLDLAPILREVMLYRPSISGVADVFCAKPVPDIGRMPALPDYLLVPPGRKSCC